MMPVVNSQPASGSGHRSFAQNLGALPRASWVLFAGTFINRFGTFVMPMLAIYLTRSGYSIAQTGIAISAYGGGHIVTSILGGHLADRFGRRNTIALSMFASGGAMLALSQARGYAAIVACTFLAGSAAELYRPASSALIGDLVAPEQRVLAFGLYRFAINLGFAGGPATAGFLADRSFLYIFVADALTSFVYGVIALVALPHGVRTAAHEEQAGEGYRAVLGDRRFVYFLAATMCLTWVDFQITSTLPIHVAKDGFSPSQYGMLISLNGVLIVVFELALTAWTQRLPAQPLIAVGYFLNCAGIALTGLAHTLPALAATVVVWTAGEMIYAPVSSAYVTNLAPERLRGRYHGLYVMAYSVGLLLGPAIGTAVFERSETALWVACGVSGMFAALLARIRPAAASTST